MIKTLVLWSIIGSKLSVTGFPGFFFFKQKTAYEISEYDWSSDVCSSDLIVVNVPSMPSKRALVVAVPPSDSAVPVIRSEERRVGKECRIGCRSRWSPGHKKKRKDVCRGRGQNQGEKKRGKPVRGA